MIIIKVPKFTEEQRQKHNLLEFDNYPDAYEIADSFNAAVYDMGYEFDSLVELKERLIKIKHIKDYNGKVSVLEEEKIARNLYDRSNKYQIANHLPLFTVIVK